MKAYVDQGACIGCGLCASICADVFEIKESCLAQSNTAEDVPQALVHDCYEAESNCPVGAITTKE